MIIAEHKPRLLLADDHRCIAEGVAGLLTQIADTVVLVHDGDALVTRAMEGSIDIVISEITIPVLSGLQALRKLRAQGCFIPFIVLSAHHEPLIVSEALAAGANGYVLKQSASTELYAAIASAANGEQYLSSGLMASLLHQPTISRKLTRRQQQVINLMAAGRATTDIATELGISVRTVESHRQALLCLLGVHSSVALIRKAERLGLIISDSFGKHFPPLSSTDSTE